MLSKTILHALAAMLLFASMAAAQIAGLCDTGQTHPAASGCTGVLVPPNPTGGGPNRDGNWELTYQSFTASDHNPCLLKGFVKAWVDTPQVEWLPDSASTASEWITPYDGEGAKPAGWYVYATSFPVPAMLPGGGVPTGITINGQLASDNATYAIYLESPPNSGNCALVTGQMFPVNPAGQGFSDFKQWWPFSFTNSIAIAPGADAYLYFVIENAYDAADPQGATPTGFRAEFFSTSAFN
jgi:hypothetical protein